MSVVAQGRGRGRAATGRRRAGALACLAAAVLGTTLATPARADDPLLQETVEFTGVVMFLQYKVPALVLGVVRDGETAVAGFGEIRDGAGTPPDGDTPMRIGSISKAMAGQVLAAMAADGTVALSDPAARHLEWEVELPTAGGRPIRLIDLATHTSGLPRDTAREHGPADDPEGTLTREAMIRTLEDGLLLYPPGSGALYSNIAYDLLGAALAGAAGRPYLELLQERVVAPAGLAATGLATARGMAEGHMLGHGFDGEQLPAIPAPEIGAPSGGLVSTPNDILKWMAWHMGRLPPAQEEVRLLDHAAWVPRDRLAPAYGLDESGHADALGLGWIVMHAEGGRPTLLQKAGGGNGIFTYMAFTPDRGIGAFVAINSFDFAAATQMAGAVNELIAQLAPR